MIFSEIQKVKKAYENSLVFPKTKPVPQFLLCPVGIIGAGKTTIVRPLAEQLSLVRVSSDEIRKLLKELGQGYEAVHTLAYESIKNLLLGGWSVAIDADCASPETRMEIEKMCREFNISAIWIHINPPEDFILRKLRNFKHSWLFKDADQAIENYQARKPIHEKLDLPFLCTIDTSREDLSKQREECVQKIRGILDLI